MLLLEKRLSSSVDSAEALQKAVDLLFSKLPHFSMQYKWFYWNWLLVFISNLSALENKSCEPHITLKILKISCQTSNFARYSRMTKRLRNFSIKLQKKKTLFGLSCILTPCPNYDYILVTKPCTNPLRRDHAPADHKDNGRQITH